MPKRKGPPTAEEVKTRAERVYKHFLPENILARIGIRKPTYFYVYGVTLRGKPIFLGPLPEEEAEAIAAGLDSGEIFELTTRDLDRAKREIKAEFIRRGRSPDESLQRLYGRKELTKEVS